MPCVSLTSWEITRQAKHFRHARYLQDTCFPLVPYWIDQSRTTSRFQSIPLPTCILWFYINIQGLKIPITPSGRIWSVLAGHLPPSRPRSTRKSRRVLIPRVDSRKTSETDSVFILRGDVEGFWSVPAMYRVPRMKRSHWYPGKLFAVSAYPVPKPFLLPIGEFNKHICTPDWSRNPPSWSTNIPDMSSLLVIVPPKDVKCLSRQWFLPTYAAWTPTSGGAWMI